MDMVQRAYIPSPLRGGVRKFGGGTSPTMGRFLREISVEFDDYWERDDYGRRYVPAEQRPLVETLNRYSGLIKAMYQHLCGPVVTKGFSKVVISASKETRRAAVESILDIIVVRSPFELDQFIRVGDGERKMMMCNLIRTNLLALARRFKWNRTPIENTFKEILQRKFELNEHWKKPVRSPDRKKTAQIYFEINAKEMRVFLEVTREQGTERIQYATSKPNYDELLMYFVGPLRWTSNTRIEQVTFYKMRSVLVAKRIFKLDESGLKVLSNKVF